MKKKLMMKKVIAAVVICLFSVLASILNTCLAFGAGWFIGFILERIAGDAITTSLNALFNAEKFVPEMLPKLCATLATLGNILLLGKCNNTKKD